MLVKSKSRNYRIQKLPTERANILTQHSLGSVTKSHIKKSPRFPHTMMSLRRHIVGLLLPLLASTTVSAQLELPDSRAFNSVVHWNQTQDAPLNKIHHVASPSGEQEMLSNRRLVSANYQKRLRAGQQRNLVRLRTRKPTKKRTKKPTKRPTRGMMIMTKRPTRGMSMKTKRPTRGMMIMTKRPTRGMMVVTKRPTRGMMTMTKRPTQGTMSMTRPPTRVPDTCICTNPKKIPTNCEVDILISLMDRAVNQDNQLAARWLRAGFHDAGTFNKRNREAGVNGCLINHAPMIQEPENLFFDLPINTLKVVKREWEGNQNTCISISGADIIQFAALFSSVRQVNPPGLNDGKKNQLRQFEWGRPDERNCQTRWSKNLPGFQLGNSPRGVAVRCQMAGKEIKDKMMDLNGFTAEEATALIGAHTIGLTRNTFGSGLAGPWVRNGRDNATPNGPVFDNSYFEFLDTDVVANTVPEFANNISPFTQTFPDWFRVVAQDLNHLDTDLALAFPTQNANDHPDFHRFTRQFASDNSLFIRRFFSSLKKMSTLGVSARLSRASACPQCRIAAADGLGFRFRTAAKTESFTQQLNAARKRASASTKAKQRRRQREIELLTTPIKI